jgi:hypothetical protein
MKTVILRQAFEELKNAVDYYEEQQAQLGLKLSDEVQQHIDWICWFPSSLLGKL